jgi:hypothetical protein
MRLWRLFLLVAVLPLTATPSAARGAPPDTVLAAVSAPVFVVITRDGRREVPLPGIALQADYVLTNHHVVEELLTVSVRQGKRSWLALRAYTHRRWNLALPQCARPVCSGIRGRRVPRSAAGRAAVRSGPSRPGGRMRVRAIFRDRIGRGAACAGRADRGRHRASGGGLFDSRGKLAGRTAFHVRDHEDLARALPGAFVIRRMRPVR